MLAKITSTQKKTRACAVDAIITSHDGESIVLIKRNHDPFKNHFVLPGGFVDPGETCEQAVVREAKEETGLDVAVKFGGLIGAYSDPDRDPRQNISLAYECAVIGPEPETFTEVSEGVPEWFSIESIRDAAKNAISIGFDHRKIIGDCFFINVQLNEN